MDSPLGSTFAPPGGIFKIPEFRAFWIMMFLRKLQVLTLGYKNQYSYKFVEFLGFQLQTFQGANSIIRLMIHCLDLPSA